MLTIDISCIIKSSIETSVKDKIIKEIDFIALLYQHCLAKVALKGVKKLVIELNDIYEDTIIIPHSQILPVCSYKQLFDFQGYIGLETEERYKMVLETIRTITKKLSAQFEWEKELFIQAYDCVLQSHFICKYIVGNKYYQSKDKKYKVAIEVELTPYDSQICLLLVDNNDTIFRQIEVSRIRSSNRLWSLIVNKGKWKSENEFIISNKSGEINYKILIKEGKVEMFLKPTLMKDEELLLLLQMIEPNKTNEERLKILQEMSIIAMRK